jgi:hypothetical protein
MFFHNVDIHLQEFSCHFSPENGRGLFLRKEVIPLLDDTVSQPEDYSRSLLHLALRKDTKSCL